MSAVRQRPPTWGVMFHDGSVKHCWTGRTALRRAIAELHILQEKYPKDQINLAYRPHKEAPWTRLVEMA